MASVVRMPSVLADATEAAIANWLVGPGDSVAVGDPMAEIETEKALVEYQAEEPGIVGRLVLAAGEAGEGGAAMAVLIVEQGALGTSYGGWLADEIQRRFFDWLDQPVQRVTGGEASPSISRVLERAAIARTSEVVAGLERVRAGFGQVPGLGQDGDV